MYANCKIPFLMLVINSVMITMLAMPVSLICCLVKGALQNNVLDLLALTLQSFALFNNS